MRVAFDVSILGRPCPTGTERAASTLIDAVLATDTDLELHLLAPDASPFSGDFGARHPWRDDGRVVVEGHLPAAGSAGRLWLWRERAVPGSLAAARCDVYHSPVVALPLRTGCPRVATVHEIPWAAPGRGGDRRLSHRVRLGLAVRAAARLLCVSRRTADDLVTLHPAAASRVAVVPHGVAPLFLTLPTLQTTTGTLAELQPGRRRLLAVGRQRGKKNLARLLAALRDPALHDIDLILAGPAGDATLALRAQAEELERAAGRPRVAFVGHVRDTELVALYDLAAAVVFPSLFEGFGLPVIEAMARGTPVIAARQGAVAEAAGAAGAVGAAEAARAAGAVERFDGEDTAALVSALRRVLEDEDRARDLVEAGRRQALTCSAAAGARAVIDLWRDVVRTGADGGADGAAR